MVRHRDIPSKSLRTNPMVKILQDSIIKGKLKVKFHDKIACKARAIIYYVYRLPATYVKPMKMDLLDGP